MSTTPTESPIREEELPLTPKKYPEIVIGLVSPAGTNLDTAASAIIDSLDDYEYHTEVINLSELIENFTIDPCSGLSEDERINKLMTKGTEIRNKSQKGDAISLLAVAKICSIRTKLEKEEKSKRAYLLRSLKHPAEAETLRNIYGKGFVLVSVYSPVEDRIKEIEKKITKSKYGEKSNAKALAMAIVERDEMEVDTKFGQAVKDIFPLADFFFDRHAKKEELERFIRLYFGHLFDTPTPDEHGMYLAKSAALRSADMGRQVGAAILSPSTELISVGCNDVPKAGGDQYWHGDEADHRDFKFQDGIDPIVQERRDILCELLSGLKKAGVVLADTNVAHTAEELITGDKRDHLKNTRVMNLLEFGRSVHAEMAAITTAARLGIPIKDATLYTTTFPCHMCAKHIVASGIKRVVYIEPYTKSKAEESHSDSIQVNPKTRDDHRIPFEPFVGVAPSQYQDLFDARDKRKDTSGNKVEWMHKEPHPRFTRYTNSYLSIEKAIISTEIPRLATLLEVNIDQIEL